MYRHLQCLAQPTGRHIGAPTEHSFHALTQAGRFRKSDRYAFLRRVAQTLRQANRKPGDRVNGESDTDLPKGRRGTFVATSQRTRRCQPNPQMSR
jgi:hypothetical protein